MSLKKLPRFPLDPTLGTLLPDAAKLVKTITDGATENFAEFGELKPVAFAVTVDGHVVMIQIAELNDETKPAVWDMMAGLREAYPIVAFVTEVWMSNYKEGNSNPDGTVKVMPRDDPNRIEQAMVTLWQGERCVAFWADIQRKPNKLSEWTVVFDSDFPPGHPGKPDSLGGEMMRGKRYPLKEN